jgi:hypothetical protein
MRARLHIIALFISFSVLSASAQEIDQLPNSGTTIRVNGDPINVGVTVTDSHGRSVPGLRREDFRIFDNGVEQPIRGFVASEEPARLFFLTEGRTADSPTRPHLIPRRGPFAQCSYKSSERQHYLVLVRI